MFQTLLSDRFLKQAILSYLSSSDLISLWEAFQDDQLEFNVPFSVLDKAQKMFTLPKLNKLTVEVYYSFQNFPTFDVLSRCIDEWDIVKIEFLLDIGVDPKTYGAGWSPLIKAVQSGCYSIVELLLRRGVDPDDGRSFNSSPIDLAAEENRIRIFELLLKYHAKMSNQTITRLFFVSTQPILNALLASDYNLDISGNNMVTPLIASVKTENVEIVEGLLKRGVNMNAYDGSGNTPLMIAVERDREDIVELLLKYGASIEVANGSTRKNILTEAIKRNNPKILKLLQK